MKTGTVLLLILASLAGHAREIYKCAHEGTVLYSHVPCAEGAKALELPALGRLGSGEDARTVRRRLEALRDMTIPGARPERRAPAMAPGLSHSERLRLRKLEMRADGLRRDLLGRRGSGAWEAATQRELRALQTQINALRAKM